MTTKRHVIDLDTGVVFPSIAYLAKALGVSHNSVYSAIRHGNKLKGMMRVDYATPAQIRAKEAWYDCPR